MLKQVVEYKDFDGNPTVETLYFNITKTELAENLQLEKALTELQEKVVNGPSRTMTTEDIQMVLDLVKTFMKLAYGIRSADGKRFIKTEDIWTEFTQTAAYDAFLFSLFEKPELAMSFMTNILPADIREQAVKETEKLRAAAIPTAEQVLEAIPVPEQTQPAPQLTPEEIAEAIRRRNDDLSGPLLKG